MTTGRCPSCSEDAVFFEHVERIATGEHGEVLLRCPRCGLLYDDGVSNEPVVISAEDAAARYAWHDGRSAN